MTPEQAKALGNYLRQARIDKGLTTRAVAAASGMDMATVVRIENGSFVAPRPDKLAAIARALDLSPTDVFARADYVDVDELPSFAPYLRSKYRDLPDTALAEMERYFERLKRQHGYDEHGPAPGEDER
jgi:transcriptional regulator with XRE-family HTH domain